MQLFSFPLLPLRFPSQEAGAEEVDGNVSLICGLLSGPVLPYCAVTFGGILLHTLVPIIVFSSCQHMI